MIKLDKIKLLELCTLYQDYLSECDVYDGADFWSNKDVQEIEKELVSQIKQSILKAIMEKAPKRIENVEETQKMFKGMNMGYEEFELVIKEILK